MNANGGLATSSATLSLIYVCVYITHTHHTHTHTTHMQETNVYSCTCTVWRHVPVRGPDKTCRHLWSIRGKDREIGRVGEDGIAKMEKAEDDLRTLQRPPVSMYICMYIYIYTYMCIYTCIHIYIHTYIHIYIRILIVSRYTSTMCSSSKSRISMVVI
jgi:hypothetical protein